LIALINGASCIPTIPLDRYRKGGKGKREEGKREGKGEEDEIKEGQEMKEALATSGSGCCGLAGSIGKAPGTYTIFLSVCVCFFVSLFYYFLCNLSPPPHFFSFCEVSVGMALTAIL
jgi:hypothetical protein